MKPAPFEYFAPDTTDEVLALLNEHGFDAKILAGGQSLVPTMNFRLAQPSILIDINRVPDLATLHAEDDLLRIGPMTRHVTLEREALIAETAPLITATMPHIAHPQIRTRGTIGGSLAHADPAAELPAIMLALDARFKLQSAEQTRWVTAKEFFVDLFMTSLEPEEMLTEIELPRQPAAGGYAFKEVARRHGDFALAGVAALVQTDEQGRCKAARIVLLSVGNGPLEAVEAQKLLAGEKRSEKLIAAAAETAVENIDPASDMHATADFRRHLAKVLVRQALEEAWPRA